MLSITLLGPCRVTFEGRPVANFPTRRAQALLIYLAMHAGQPLRREFLMELLWPGMPPASAQTNLRQAIYQLRRTLAQAGAGAQDIVAADRQHVWFDSNTPLQTDVALFRQVARPDRELASWRQAAALCQGDFLADLYLADSEAFEQWAAGERADLRREVLELLARLADAEAAAGHVAEAEACARRRLALDDLNEDAHRQLIEILARGGRRSEALAQVARCRELLQFELGLPPSATLEALVAALHAGELGPAAVSIAAADVDPPHAQPAPPRHNLHPAPTPFIGREEEIALLGRALQNAQSRLLTIVGPGGIGKSRLALALASQLVADDVGRFPDGIFFVPLASVSSAGQMVAAIAGAIGLHLESGQDRQAKQSAAVNRAPREQLLDYLRHKRMLLVLDNYEHLLEPGARDDQDAAALTGAILQAAPGVVVLATSRERLHLREEHVFLLGGMPVPPSPQDGELGSFAAVQLFLQRARQVQPAFALKPADAEEIVRICGQVEGMPLALELAASWADTLSVAGIAAEMARGLDFLASDLRNLPPRHRSIRAVFDRSWQQLHQADQEVLAKMAVFRGGFSRAAAAAITGVTLRQLAALVNKSLVHYQPGQDRYQLHELLRQYCTERLVQFPVLDHAARDAHAAYYCDFVTERQDRLKARRQAVALTEIEQNLGNILVAWEFAVAQKAVSRLRRATEALMLFFAFSGRSEDGVRAFSTAVDKLRALATPEHLAADGELVRLLAQLLCAQAHSLPNIEEGKNLVLESLALLQAPALGGRDVRTEEALAYFLLGEATQAQGYALARAPYTQALERYRALGDAWGQVLTLNSLGWLAWSHGDYAQGKQFAQEAQHWNQELGNRQQEIESLLLLANLELWLGDLEQAEAHLKQVIEAEQKLESPSFFAAGLRQLTILETLRGNYAAASASAARTSAAARERGNRAAEAYSDVTLSLQIIHLGEYRRAQRLLAESLHYFEDAVGQPHHMIGLSHQALGMAALGLAHYDEAVVHLNAALADQRTTDRPSDIAGSLAYLGRAHLARDQVEDAAASLQQSVRTAVETHSIIPLLEALVGLAALAYRVGDRDEAEHLLTLAACYPLLTGSRLHRTALDALAAQLGIPLQIAAGPVSESEVEQLWAVAATLLMRFFARSP